MDSNLRQKKVVTVYMTKIDILNIQNGETVSAKVKTNFEVEIPYEVVVRLDGQKEEDNRE